MKKIVLTLFICLSINNIVISMEQTDAPSSVHPDAPTSMQYLEGSKSGKIMVSFVSSTLKPLIEGHRDKSFTSDVFVTCELGVTSVKDVIKRAIEAFESGKSSPKKLWDAYNANKLTLWTSVWKNPVYRSAAPHFGLKTKFDTMEPDEPLDSNGKIETVANTARDSVLIQEKPTPQWNHIPRFFIRYKE